MKIKHLIDKLKDLDPELDVLIEGYEDYYDTPEISGIIEFEPNVHKEWYYGKHEERKGGSKKGIVLKRPNKTWEEN